MSRETEWRVGVARFNKLIDQRTDEVQRGAALLVAEAVSTGLGRFRLPGTPVDTGFARSSWRVGVNADPQFGPAKNPSTVKKGERGAGGRFLAWKVPPPDFGPAVLSVTAADTVMIATNVPYMPRLEYGHSAQAPQGFVRLTVAAFPRLIKSVMARLRRSPA